jgi:hypothetical protein
VTREAGDLETATAAGAGGGACEDEGTMGKGCDFSIFKIMTSDTPKSCIN